MRCGPGCPASRSTPPSSGRRPSSRLSIDNLTRSLLIGAFLVVIILFLFLYEWRVALISATIIPLSLMAVRARAQPARRDDQRDDAGGVGDRHRRGGRRRDRRRREHRAASPPAPHGGQHPVDRADHPRGLGRGPRRHRLRVADRDRGSAAGLLPAGPVGRVLPAARQRLRGGSAGIPADRADRHAGAGLHPAWNGRRSSTASLPIVSWLHRVYESGAYGRPSASRVWRTPPSPSSWLAGIMVWPLLGNGVACPRSRSGTS